MQHLFLSLEHWPLNAKIRDTIKNVFCLVGIRPYLMTHNKYFGILFYGMLWYVVQKLSVIYKNSLKK